MNKSALESLALALLEKQDTKSEERALNIITVGCTIFVAAVLYFQYA